MTLFYHHEKHQITRNKSYNRCVKSLHRKIQNITKRDYFLMVEGTVMFKDNKTQYVKATHSQMGRYIQCKTH